MKNTSFKTTFPTETIHEGKVNLIVPKLAAFVSQPSDYAPSKAPVFYNPVMELNRDLAVLTFRAYQRTSSKAISICEPLTSSGIRGVRFAAEINGVERILISDINEHALKLARLNVDLNGLQDLIEIEKRDANCLLSCHGAPRKRFDIIDIDPFGSPVPYLESAIRALRNKGLLAATATDLAPLCGVHPKPCIRRYGGKPLRTEYCQELAVRLLAGSIAAAAAKQDIGIRVVFSHSTDHYIRVYAQVMYGAKKADASITAMGYVLHCFHCFHRETLKTLSVELFKTCPECGSRMQWAGPLWLGTIFNQSFCDSLFKENKHIAFRNSQKIAKLLGLTQNEAEAPATYYVIDHITDKLALPVPSVHNVINRLRERGFQAMRTHFNARGIRTNAPALTVQQLLRDASGTS
jgi:tRNA (guanine26-N2/guanine27-N2)-dimethyltransferase